MRHTIIIFVSFLLFACSSKEVSIPDDVIKKEKMIGLITDLKILEGAVQKRVIKQKTQQEIVSEQTLAIFKKHGITEEKFNRSFEFYQSEPDLMHGIYEKVLERLSEQQAEAKKNKATAPPKSSPKGRTS